jgi:hypothetical protein
VTALLHIKYQEPLKYRAYIKAHPNPIGNFLRLTDYPTHAHIEFPTSPDSTLLYSSLNIDPSPEKSKAPYLPEAPRARVTERSGHQPVRYRPRKLFGMTQESLTLGSSTARAAVHGPNVFSKLPIEIVTNIFSFLPRKDIVRCLSTCREVISPCRLSP